VKKVIIAFLGLGLIGDFGFKLFFPAGARTARLLQDYFQASYQLAALLHPDPQSLEYNTWRVKLGENRSRWKEIEQRSLILKFWYSLPSLPKIFAATEVSLQSHQLENEIDLVFSRAPRGQKIKKVMEYLHTDARTAQRAIEKTYQVKAEIYQDKARVNQKLAQIAQETQDASFTLVAVGGTIISGGELLAAKSFLTGAYHGVALVVNGTDVVLTIGEKGAILADNRRLQTVIADLRKKIGPVTQVLALVDLKTGLKNEPGNWVTLAGYAQAINDWLENRSQDSPAQLTFDFQGKNLKIDYSISPDLVKNYFQAPVQAIWQKDLAYVFPSGDYLIQGQPIRIVAVNQTPDNTQEKSESKESKKGSFYEQFCWALIELSKIKEEKFPLSTEECINGLNQKIEKGIAACQNHPPEDRSWDGVPCTREGVSKKVEEFLRKEMVSDMKKFCQTECDSPECREVCERVEKL